jgi:serralysin
MLNIAVFGVGLGYCYNSGDIPAADRAVFLDSGEFQDRFGSNLTNSQFVGTMYANVLLRTPDTGGIQFWGGAVE